MEVVCLFRTVSISDDFVSVWKDTFSVVFGLKLCHEMEGGSGLVTALLFWKYDIRTIFYKNRYILDFNTTSGLYILTFLTKLVTIFGPVSY
jgi:hypothetical protein